VRLADENGLFHNVDPSNDYVAIVATLRLLWSNFRAKLATDSALDAASFVRLDSRPRFEQAFTALGANLSTVDDSWSDITPVTVQANYAQFTVTQTLNGQTYLYLVTFARNDDGTWSIAEL